MKLDEIKMIQNITRIGLINSPSYIREEKTMKLEKFRLFRVRPYTTKQKENKLQITDMYNNQTISSIIPLGENWFEYSQRILKEQGFKLIGMFESNKQRIVYICKDSHKYLEKLEHNEE